MKNKLNNLVSKANKAKHFRFARTHFVRPCLRRYGTYNIEVFRMNKNCPNCRNTKIGLFSVQCKACSNSSEISDKSIRQLSWSFYGYSFLLLFLGLYLRNEYPTTDEVVDIHFPLYGLAFIIYYAGAMYYLSKYVTFQSRKSDKQEK
jgi:hypothetical protein